jgi:hypothetical protein
MKARTAMRHSHRIVAALTAMALSSGVALAQQTPAQLLQNAQTLQPPAAAAPAPRAAPPAVSSVPMPDVGVAPAAPEVSGPLTSSAGCEADLTGLQNKYLATVSELNKMITKTQKKLDPVASCPRLKVLLSIDQQVYAYMQKNQAWCGIPDDLISQIEQRRSKDSTYSTQACNFAAEMKKAQAQQAAGGGAPQAPRLPSGPL